MFRSSVLLLALLLSSPALFSAFVTGDMSMTSALIRLLIAMPAAALMLGALRSVTGDYKRGARKAAARKRLMMAAERSKGTGNHAGV